MAKEIRLSREELYEKVWAQPTVKVAAEFGISDVALAKICRKMNVPKPPPGYWRKVETGAKLKLTPLPKSTGKTREFIYLNIRTENDASLVNPEIQALIDREDLPESQIKISDDFEKAHELVKNTKAFYDQTPAGESELISPPAGKGFLNLSVSPTQTVRALLIMDALIKALEARGYQVIVSADHWGEETRIIKEGEEVRISLYERLRKVERELTPEEKKKPPYLLNREPNFEPDGRLTVKISTRFSHYQKWGDRKNEPLGNRLNDVVAGAVAFLESLVAEKRRQQAEEERRREAIRQREEENRRREQLETDVRLWHKCRDIQDYLNAYEARLIEIHGKIDPAGKEGKWLKWARAYAESLDPLSKIFAGKE